MAGKRVGFMKSVKGSSLAELKAKSLELAEELMKLRFKQTTGQLDKPSNLGQVRRDLARVKTLIGQKQAEAKAA